MRAADYIQESAPERLPIKQALYKELAMLAKPDAILASSTSGPAGLVLHCGHSRTRTPVSSPTRSIRPISFPSSNSCPAPWTASDVVDRTEALMKRIGQVPIRLNREIAGFVVNRLQSAVLSEAFRLVEDGICGAADVDAAVSEGLGLRWFFLGPFETIDLNAQGGVADYCDKLGPMYYDLAKEQADPRVWSEALVAKIEAQRREKTPADRLDARKAWRVPLSCRLLSRAKRAVSQGRGSRVELTHQVVGQGKESVL